MSEIVNHHQERTIPEYELIRKHQILPEERLRSIIKAREIYQYKLSRSSKSLRDYGNYVVFEKKLYELVKATEISRNQQFPGLKAAMANRIVRLYKEAIRVFPDEYRLWDAYLKFCKTNFPSEVPVAYEKLFQKRGDKPKIWNSAALYFHELGNNSEKVKSIFFRGLQRHPESELLFTSFFRVLLSETAAMAKDLQPASLKRVVAIYNTAKKKICNVDFLVTLIKQCEEEKYASFSKPLQKMIVNDMMILYPREEAVWDLLARRVLAGEPIDKIPENDYSMSVDNEIESQLVEEDDKDEKNFKDVSMKPIPTLKARIEECFKIYQTAVTILKTPEMWSMFIRCMLQLNNDLSTQAVLKRKKLASAFRGAHDANCMTDEYYHAYITLLIESNSNKEFIIEMMDAASKRFCTLRLWEQRLTYHIMENNRQKVYEVFREGTKLLGVNSFSLWKLAIQYFMTYYDDKALIYQQIMREACAIEAPQFMQFRPQYLEWSVLNQSFQATRSLYEELRTLSPPCLELHHRMARLEIQALKPDTEKVRYCYENSVIDFGKTRPDVWIEFIKFERDYGQPKKMAMLCERAKNTLSPMFVDNFITEHCLLTVEGSYK